MFETVTVFKVMYRDTAVDCFTSQQFLTADAALVEARKKRDTLNNSEFGLQNERPYRIVRAFRRNRAKFL